ncbi:MAG: mechanosensitive ion channel [Deltaproteobacteria bacterium]
MLDQIRQWLLPMALSAQALDAIALAASLLVLVLLTFLAHSVSKKYFVLLMKKAVHRTSNRWDNTLFSRGFFSRLGSLLPIIILYLGADLIFPAGSKLAVFIHRLAMTLFVIGGLRLLDALLLSIQDIYSSSELAASRPIGGYIGATKIGLYVIGAIFLISVLTGQSPWGILSVLGGLTAVILLIFKDTILGFVASIQISANDLVRIGDWVEMPKYGADGDVIDVSIHTIKVQNWDKTITTIPTYAMVSDAFKNWRGMKDSGGRRIKRAVCIDMSSIRFCTEEMLERFQRIAILKEYLNKKDREIIEHNARLGIDNSELVNGRRQTNIGVFRAYVTNYLRNHPMINQEMTFLIRHLPPSSQGLPLEIYVFCRDKVWANYEAIQADIFDHILAVVPEFDLRVFQYPSGFDLGQMQPAGATSP